MTPRKRSKKNKGLEPNLYIDSKGYYMYRRSSDGRFFGMGRDRAKAQQAARTLNARFYAASDLIAKVIGGNSTQLASVIDTFIKDKVEKHPTLAKSTKKEKTYRLERIKRDKGDTPIQAINTQWCAEYLDTEFSGDSYRQHRSILKQVFDYAQTKGWAANNPVTPTDSSDLKYTKQRQRLTLEGYKAIREIAPPWFKVAMDLALLCCQGRYEVAHMRFDHIKDGRLYVIREKTKKTEASHISIEVSPALKRVISESRALIPLSPFLVHRTPERSVKRSKKLAHWAQVTPEMLTRKFKELRDQIEMFADVPTKQRPTFHELRALGGHLLEDIEKRPPEQVQALMGHADLETTDIYLKGHKERWINAKAANFNASFLENI